MKIVIVGAGEVGTHLAKMLSKENHDIVLLDDTSEKLQQIANQVDLLTVTGHANSFKDLREAGSPKADLFIAVTPYEERNIFACILAKDMGAKKTIARINNGEYLLEKNMEKLRGMGIDELIYPESLAAKEIVSSIKQVVTRQQIEFSGGKLILYGVKIRGNAPIVNHTLEEVASLTEHVRAVAINREHTTIIPNGSDSIKSGDIVFFMASKGYQNDVFKMAGKELFTIKNIMILGGSRIAQRTAEKLGDQYNIKIIELDRERSQKVADRLENVLVIHGDGRNLDLLKEERIERMDAFIAVTGNSETNILSCHLAKTMGVRRTVAEVENIDFMDIAESMDIGSLVNKKLLAASYIYKYTVGPSVTHVKCLTASDAEVIEFIAKQDSKITKKPIRDLSFPSDAIIGGVIRDNQGLVATGDTQINEGDTVVVFALPSAIGKLDKFF
ncbi:MAG: Trk system potassium transport protein TrkA [Bacteroidetes bacterium GWF2_42_66]|nr:MAG: Trk system potassium transport protein TrkA [Bacteroidetes bacterium GWE2_42_39]OFY40561.1 MAG: Trk system potassium transport protein TrkA [Bacteroidetes bacterium GWF2_42_66]HBL74512.1 Trk system potassium transporter TrkA [Prolixibacteraceae bacterium]HCR91845.1 Trk system potassium transporter TrkA [Prolixibacteraceae bacterium]HCU63538.1 Trk system potassium transporter TrkA [Prolixibacteraceae bacterium]